MGLEKYRSGERFTQTLSVAVDMGLMTRIEALREQKIKVTAWVRDLIAQELPRLEREAKKLDACAKM